MSTPTPHRAFLLCPGMFEDPRLRSLRSSRPNRDLMFEVLADERYGLCERVDITVMSNEPHSVVKPRLEHWFASASADEVLVFFYSGHGLASPDAELRLATATAGEHGSHAISGSELAAWIEASRARQVFLIVDAAHAGPQDVRTDGHVYQIIGSGDSVALDSPAGQPSTFTEWIATWFATTPAPTLGGLFEALHGPQPLQIVPQTSEPIAAAPVVVAPSDDTIRVDIAATPPFGAPAPAFEPTTVAPRTLQPSLAPAPAPPPAFLAAPADRRHRRWMAAASAVLVVAGVAGALTRCGGDDEEAGSTTPTSVAATAPSGSVDATSVPTSVVVPGVGTTIAAPVETTTVPVDMTTVVPTTTAVASAAPTTVPPTTAAPGTIELGIPNHPLAKPACTGGWIAQLASVDASSEYAKASVEELLGMDGSSYTYAPDSCSTFDQGGNWYVVYLGPYTTRTDAVAACEASGDEDCFARQLE